MQVVEYIIITGILVHKLKGGREGSNKREQTKRAGI